MTETLQPLASRGAAAGPGKLRESRCVPAQLQHAGAAPSQDLAVAFRDSDAAAAEVLVTTLLPLVTRLVRRLTAWSEEGDDLVQDVLTTALAARAKFRGQSSLETWITRITVNCCRAHQRKQWLRTRLFGDWARRTYGGDVDERRSAERAAICKEQSEQVRAAVARLPMKSREAIVLCYLEQLSVDDAAAALGVRRGTVDVRLSRARGQLRELLLHIAPNGFLVVEK